MPTGNLMTKLAELARSAAEALPGYEFSLDEVIDPVWPHDPWGSGWEHKVPEEIRDAWDELSLESKLVSFIQAIECAETEDYPGGM